MHEPWQSQLPLYVAGVLPPDQREAVETHLATCEACRVLIHEWERIGAAVRSEAAARVEGASLPPLPATVPFPQREAAASRNGQSSEHPLLGRTAHNHEESHDMSSMMSITTAQTIEREWPRRQPRLRLAPTLIAALLLAILFGGALLLFSARQDGVSTSLGAPLGGDAGSRPAAIQNPATETATPLPSATPVDATVPPQGGEAPPPAGEPLQATPTPIPFEGPAIEMLAPTVAPPPLPSSASLEGVRYEAQEWNNAGPATLAMALSYYGWTGDQQAAANWLKPEPEDKSVSPWQMVAYVNGQTPYRAIYRMGGTLDALKSAVAAGFPVIAAVGLETDSDGWFGHYQLVTGYDENAGVLLVYDSYLGPTTGPHRIPFGEFDAAWRQFNRTFVVAFPADRAGDVRAVLLGYDDPAYGARMALDAALRATANSPDDVWSWFNLGTSYTIMGRFEDAAAAYDRALEMGLPFRTLWYQFGPFEAYFGAGRYDDVLALCASVLEGTPYVEEARYWQALVYTTQGEVEDASRALEQLIALNPNFFVGERARFQVAPDALAPELFGSVTLTQEAGQPTLLLTPTPIPQGTPLMQTPIRVEPTPTLPPTAIPSGTPILATPIRIELTPTPAR